MGAALNARTGQNLFVEAGLKLLAYALRRWLVHCHRQLVFDKATSFPVFHCETGHIPGPIRQILVIEQVQFSRVVDDLWRRDVEL